MKDLIRCGWAGEKPHMIRYHDREWGRPVHRDRKHFEMLLDRKSTRLNSSHT